MRIERFVSLATQSICWIASVLVAAPPCLLIDRFLALGRAPDNAMTLTIILFLAMSLMWATLPRWWKS